MQNIGKMKLKKLLELQKYASKKKNKSVPTFSVDYDIDAIVKEINGEAKGSKKDIKLTKSRKLKTL